MTDLLPTWESIERATHAVSELGIRTPIITKPRPTGADGDVRLKLELLQPTRSFKIRGASNAISVGRARQPEASGVSTISAGNMGLATAYIASLQGLSCTIVVPDSAPLAKVDPLRRMGARVQKVPFDEWWARVEGDRVDGAESDTIFVHPFLDADVIAGNATIGLELATDLPDVTDVYVPWGGGGLAVGIAAGLCAAGSTARVHGVEVDTAAPLDAAYLAGSPVKVQRTPSFVDGIGSNEVLASMWELAQHFSIAPCAVPVVSVETALREMATELGIVAEGAGAASVAAAERARETGRPSVAIVSGGNLDPDVLRDILFKP